MSTWYQCPTCTAFNLTKAKMHLEKALDLIEEENLIHMKLRNDFYSIGLFCNEEIEVALNRARTVDPRKKLEEMERDERDERMSM